MDFNDKIPTNTFPVLETPTFSTKPHSRLSPLSNDLGFYLSNWYQKIKGEMMTLINGKLVELNWRKPQAEQLTNLAQPEISEDTEIETLNHSVILLENRINQVENQTHKLEKMCQKLEKLEKRSSQKLLALTLVGTVGLTTLGIWSGLSDQGTSSAENLNNYPETNQLDNR